MIKIKLLSLLILNTILGISSFGQSRQTMESNKSTYIIDSIINDISNKDQAFYEGWHTSIYNVNESTEEKILKNPNLNLQIARTDQKYALKLIDFYKVYSTNSKGYIDCSIADEIMIKSGFFKCRNYKILFQAISDNKRGQTLLCTIGFRNKKIQFQIKHETE